jgi:hypothetical protein
LRALRVGFFFAVFFCGVFSPLLAFSDSAMVSLPLTNGSADISIPLALDSDSLSQVENDDAEEYTPARYQTSESQNPSHIGEIALEKMNSDNEDNPSTSLDVAHHQAIQTNADLCRFLTRKITTQNLRINRTKTRPPLKPQESSLKNRIPHQHDRPPLCA